jgi:hypothetical protein
MWTLNLDSTWCFVNLERDVVPKYKRIVSLNLDTVVRSDLLLKYPGSRTSTLSESGVSFLQHIESVER